MKKGIHRRLVIDVTPDLIERLKVGMLVGSDNECWPWTKSTRSGYGVLRHRNRLYSTHCVAWVIASGEQIPEGMIVRHACDNKLCNNPLHLAIGTPTDNVHDVHERHPERVARIRGAMHPNVVLTEPLVRAIRLLHRHGYGRVRLARELGLEDHEHAIISVLKGQSWRHVS